MRSNKRYIIFNIIKFLCFAGIVILSFGYTEMSFKYYLVPAYIRELYIIFSIILSFFIGDLFIKILQKKKLLVFISNILLLCIVIIFRLTLMFVGMSLCIIYMYISFKLSIKYFIDFFIKESKLVYIALSLLNFFILVFICEFLSIGPLV
ncbi:hypothetical protein QOZ91_000906 [Clostridium sardiniense]|nr:hypothetical protein [Clostridium sardiniense]